MITLLVEENNHLSQSFYNSCINNIQFHQLTCSCGHSGCLIIHGYYKRKVKSSDGSFWLVVCRVKCTECGKTHAILPSSIVPYSQISLTCCCQIIADLEDGTNPCSVCNENPDIDENNVASVLRRFRKHWQQRLLSECIQMIPLRNLVLSCFTHFSAQFLKIRRTVNLLYPKTT